MRFAWLHCFISEVRFSIFNFSAGIRGRIAGWWLRIFSRISSWLYSSFSGSLVKHHLNHSKPACTHHLAKWQLFLFHSCLAGSSRHEQARAGTSRHFSILAGTGRRFSSTLGTSWLHEQAAHASKRCLFDLTTDSRLLSFLRCR